MKNQKGFTLIEFIVVCLIIMLLSIVGAAQYKKHQKEKDLPKTHIKVNSPSKDYENARSVIIKYCNNARLKQVLNTSFTNSNFNYECDNNVVFETNFGRGTVKLVKEGKELLLVRETLESAELQVLLHKIYEKFNKQPEPEALTIEEDRKKELEELLK